MLQRLYGCCLFGSNRPSRGLVARLWLVLVIWDMQVHPSQVRAFSNLLCASFLSLLKQNSREILAAGSALSLAMSTVEFAMWSECNSADCGFG
jgi:hypothetical protein